MESVLDLDDAAAVQAVRDGDPAAFGVLFRRWFDRAYDVALGVLRNPDSAAEVAQEAMLKAWQRLDALEDPERFGPWLLCSVRNRAVDRWHREKRQVPTDGDTMVVLDSLRQGPGAGAGTAEPGVGRDLEAAESRALVWAAAEALGPDDLSLLDLQVRHDLAPADIADELGLNANAVHQRLFRLRKRMGTSIGAFVLWNEGDPRCKGLAGALDAGGVEAFGTKATSVIERHQRACIDCGQDRRRRVSPEALLSAVPIATAPFWLKTQAAAALEQAGGPPAALTATEPDAGGGSESEPPESDVQGSEESQGPTDGGAGSSVTTRGASLAARIPWRGRIAAVAACTVAAVGVGVWTAARPDKAPPADPAAAADAPPSQSMPTDDPSTTTPSATLPPETLPPETLPPETMPPETVPPETTALDTSKTQSGSGSNGSGSSGGSEAGSSGGALTRGGSGTSSSRSKSGSTRKSKTKTKTGPKPKPKY